MNEFVKQQIALLQQSVWDLQKARDNIQMAIGASDLGKIYIEQLSELIDSIDDDMINLHDEG
jgi:hypothetical protein